MSAADIVRAAVRTSGGLGDAWCSGADVRQPDAVRVGSRLVVVETDGDNLGWLMTTYAVSDDGAEATPIAVIAGENPGAVHTLTSWLRTTAGPMAWKRIRPGLYRSGAYFVGQLDTGEWFAEGPGVDQAFDDKAQAQRACDAARTGTRTQG
ncbi:hypothetical protein [Mycolicibacterium palauense]|uniref:hypothetical protein n=1 Tax=Mycolicibacterium palauense TaxID=2034511 RepID=UPI000BFF0B02|nr:hypothetical protein [Mycolicibacterium palauense]